MEGLSPEFLQASLVRVAVIVLMVSLGMRVPVSAIAAAVRGGRTFGAALLVGLVLVPALGWAVVHVLGLPDAVAIGILLLAAAPGGSLGLKLVDLAHGDVALGLGLFFAISLLAPFSVPLTATVLISSRSGIGVDPLPLLATLVVIQLLPLAIALVVARRAPGPARRIGALATTATTVLLAAIIVTAVVVNLDDVLAVGPRGVAAMVVIAGGALLCGLLVQRERPTVGRAIGLLAAQRSTSLALLIATSMGVPAVTGAVVAGGLVLLVLNPLAARVLAGREAGWLQGSRVLAGR